MGGGGGGRHKRSLAIIFVAFLLVSGMLRAPLIFAGAARPLHMPRDWWPRDWSMFLGSLPKGSVAPSGPSGCTSNPNNNGGPCPIS
ncbi:hypothetical protein KSP40_PGU004377 [Platanthera guangdongensis]|uniref:Uncharacterized protein n=1 Tax=Platanthera guangdongensis TaxID=2320717 RepID=A0ABR2N4K4_9ASPA